MKIKESRLFTIIKLIVSWGFAIIFLVPLLWTVFVSFKKEGSHIANVFSYFIPPYTNENYIHVLRDSAILNPWMLNSAIVAVITTILVLLVSSLAAYPLSNKMKFTYKKFMYFFFLAGLMVPGEATIIPLYVIANKLGILNSYQGLIIPSLAGPLAIIILKSFFDSIPRDLLDSAKIDGCGTLRTFMYILLPLSKSSLSAIGIFTFLGSWNNFLWPLLCISSSNLYTLPVGLPVFNTTYTKDYALPMTGNAIASIPVIIAFLFFEKQIVQGIALTGIKE